MKLLISASHVIRRQVFCTTQFHLQARCFSVKELPWCAPKESPVRRARVPTKDHVEYTKIEAKKESLLEPIQHFGIVAAMAKNRVIGVNGRIPWRIPKDREIFKSLTKDQILIIGRRTFEEHPKLMHVNHSKCCIVVSKSLKGPLEVNQDYAPKTEFQLVQSFQEALGAAKEMNNTLQIGEEGNGQINCWVAGGQKIYEEALRHKSASEVHLSVVDKEIYLADSKDVAFFPPKHHWDNEFEKPTINTHNGTEDTPGFSYFVYTRRRRKP